MIRRKNCLNARPKMTSDKFDDATLLARKTMTTAVHSSSLLGVKYITATIKKHVRK